MAVILLSNHYSETPLSIIQSVVPKGFTLITLEKPTKKELISKVSLADYVLASGRLQIDREVIEAAQKLKMVQRTGVGTDTLDMTTLNSKGIPVYINFGINSDSVAEHTILLMLALLRRITSLDNEVKKGVWIKQANGLRNFDLKNKIVGIVGLGSIGQKVNRLLKAFGAHVYYFDPYRLSKNDEEEHQIEYRPLNEILAISDIVSLHCSLTSSTRNLIGIKELASMKKGAILVNTARGGLINEDALVDALNSNHLGGAALDVFNSEPILQDSNLLNCKNLVLTPHIGGVTFDSFKAMMIGAISNIELFEKGALDTISNKRFRG